MISAAPAPIKVGLIQVAHGLSGDEPPVAHYQHAIAQQEQLIHEAGRQGVQVVCLQELCTGPYFAPSQDARWFELTEAVPDGPTIRWAQQLAQQYGMVMIVPVFEQDGPPGFYYNTAAVIDADGRYVGKYRKNHLPQVAGFWEKFFFRPGNLGYPVFDTAVGRIGVFICYDRHFPECARMLALNGAELLFNPSATVAGLSENLWAKEQVAQAIANGVFIGAVNRVGTEAPWNIGHFYGTSYVVNPYGDIIAQGSRDHTELVVADVDLSQVREARQLWQFFRDRRPDTYQGLLTP